MSVIPHLKRGFRRLTAPGRTLPGVLGIGALRSGTTALFASLSHHHDIGVPSRKEIQFFDINYGRGQMWYRAFFPLGHQLTIDFSPSYMNHPEASTRAHEVVPDARIIVQLRDPVERAWSQYRLRKANRTEFRTFTEAVEWELTQGVLGLSDYSQSAEIPYLGAGRYAEQLRKWIDVFGKDRVLVLDSAELFAEPHILLARVQEFIGVNALKLPFGRSNSAPNWAPPDIIQELRGYFDGPDAELRELLGRSFSWM